MKAPPIFPEFKKLEIEDREFVENFTKKFPPYNDFEFIDLWIYNPRTDTTISLLNNNLVVKRQDYITDDFFYTFLGANNSENTISKLLTISKKENLGNQLKHIPEISIDSSSCLHDYFSIIEDPDNFDYILPINEIAELKGGKYYDKRNLVNRFRKMYPDHSVKPLDLTQEKNRQDIRKLFYLWEQQKGKKRSETEIELIAVKKLFDLVSMRNISGLGVYHENRLIGFTTYHLLPDNYAGMSLEKGDNNYQGIYPFLNHETAKILKKLGCTYLNYEQDLGIPGLKKAKMLWKPLFFLKKYTIQELPHNSIADKIKQK